jgi:exopolysaccharide production protein ExoZ
MRRLSGLQYVRGIAACGVLAYHAADRAGVRLGLGEAGVDLFFVLSGFLMWAITDETSRPGPFLIDRLKRILPGYWAATTVMLAGALIGLFPQVRLSIGHVFASYAFLPWISPSNGQVWPLLVPGWTLNYEMAFYGLFALVLLGPRERQLGLLTLLLAGLALAGWVLRPESTAMRFYTDPHILEFLGGLWLGRLWEKGGPSRVMAPVLVLAAVLGFAVSQMLPASLPKTVLFGLPALLTLAAVLAFERRSGGIGGWPLLDLSVAYAGLIGFHACGAYGGPAGLRGHHAPCPVRSRRGNGGILADRTADDPAFRRTSPPPEGGGRRSGLMPRG